MEIQDFEGRDAQAKNIEGWGADRRPEDRPGIPRERTPPPTATSAAGFLDQQREGEPPVHADRLTPTPVFGGKQPTHGLSGRIRRAAYRIPNHKAHHWLLLLLADRVDVIETSLGSRFKSRPFLVGLAAAAVLGVAGGALLRGRR